MNELTKEYCFLFNQLSETMTQLDALKRRLLEAQRIAEELYIAREGEHGPEQFTQQAG